MLHPPDLCEDNRAATEDLARTAVEPQLRHRWPVMLPLLGILLLSWFIREYDIDRKVSSLSYDAAHNHWPFARAEPYLFFYRYGIYPPVILGFAGLATLLFSRWMFAGAESKRLKNLRRGSVFILLMLLIGPGLIVNVGLKELWGRPRPLLCRDFGGEMTFRPVGEMGPNRFPNSSFPSGHAAVAFFLMAPAFVVSPHQFGLRLAWLIAGLTYGFAMGFTRVLQGGHFVSDILWAGMIVYLVGVGLAWLLDLHGAVSDSDAESMKLQDSISVSPTS